MSTLCLALLNLARVSSASTYVCTYVHTCVCLSRLSALSHVSGGGHVHGVGRAECSLQDDTV